MNRSYNLRGLMGIGIVPPTTLQRYRSLHLHELYPRNTCTETDYYALYYQGISLLLKIEKRNTTRGLFLSA